MILKVYTLKDLIIMAFYNEKIKLPSTDEVWRWNNTDIKGEKQWIFVKHIWKLMIFRFTCGRRSSSSLSLWRTRVLWFGEFIDFFYKLQVFRSPSSLVSQKSRSPLWSRSFSSTRLSWSWSKSATSWMSSSTIEPTPMESVSAPSRQENVGFFFLQIL